MTLLGANRVTNPAAVGAILLAAVLLAGVVQGHEENDAAPGSIVVTHGDCAALVEHKPAADVEYRPGVDVRGRSVVPAGIAGPSPIAAPGEIAIDVTVQVYQFLGRTPPRGLGDTNAQVGRLVFADGKWSFTGEPLSDSATHAIAKECGERLGR